MQITFSPTQTRPYSMAGLMDDALLEFHVQRAPNGRVSGYIAEQLRVGDVVKVSGPLGAAYLRQRHVGPMLCVAGGTGLAPILSVRVVDGLEAAVEHIRAYGSGHTEAIVTEDAEAAAAFLNTVDSAIVIWNASTQFADGGEFGMGAEIGIATGKLHARGPVGAEQLTSFKYLVTGDGTVRK